ncbi:hypothetical protein Catovirus_1_79 [Catovirus CTV1]|uniref:Uncharacterized protein n=1 Tax=Catovirus CTV1 TaxID=1977631 RepID=A0A1V0S8J9_9VIRU|nr:hypothetical protein Catovirus_1_79 [Catovirus CTV1]
MTKKNLINTMNNNNKDNNNNTELMNNSTKNEKNLGRPNKNEKYKNERKEVLDKLLKILDINENNKIFYVEDLENNAVKKEQIQNLIGDIKQYFSCSMWVYFAKKEVSWPLTSISRSILKSMNVKVTTVALRDNETNKIAKKGFKVHI